MRGKPSKIAIYVLLGFVQLGCLGVVVYSGIKHAWWTLILWTIGWIKISAYAERFRKRHCVKLEDD